MHYYTFFKDFLNKVVLVNKLRRVLFFDFTYKKEDLGSRDKKLKEKKYYSYLNKCIRAEE